MGLLTQVIKQSTLQAELTSDESVTPFAFAHRPENQIAKSGIENNYEECTLEPYSATTKDTYGNLISRTLIGSRKSEFPDYISENGTHQHFTHFKGLSDVINQILQGTTSVPAGPQVPPS